MGGVRWVISSGGELHRSCRISWPVAWAPGRSTVSRLDRSVILTGDSEPSIIDIEAAMQLDLPNWDLIPMPTGSGIRSPSVHLRIDNVDIDLGLATM